MCYSILFPQYRNPKRFTWLEWVFLAVSATAILAALILNIRSVIVFAERGNFTLNESNFCSNTSSAGFVFSCQSDLILGIVVLVNICKWYTMCDCACVLCSG